jgi:hypothetical protein
LPVGGWRSRRFYTIAGATAGGRQGNARNAILAPLPPLLAHDERGAWDQLLWFDGDDVHAKIGANPSRFKDHPSSSLSFSSRTTVFIYHVN